MRADPDYPEREDATGADIRPVADSHSQRTPERPSQAAASPGASVSPSPAATAAQLDAPIPATEKSAGCRAALNQTQGGSKSVDGDSFAQLVQGHLGELKPEDSVFLCTMGCSERWALDKIVPGTGMHGSRVTIASHHDNCWRNTAKDHSSNIPGYPNCKLIHPYMPRCSPKLATTGLGLQHGKLILVFRETNLRVIVSSANLNRGNWTQHTNMSWWQDFPRRTATVSGGVGPGVLGSLFDPEPWEVGPHFLLISHFLSHFSHDTLLTCVSLFSGAGP